MLRWLKWCWRAWVDFACWEPEYFCQVAPPLLLPSRPLLDCLSIVDDGNDPIRR